jgi:dUTP pyrophosphatase
MSLDTEVRRIYDQIKNNRVCRSAHFAILKLYVSNDDLKQLYWNKVDQHNNQFLQNPHPDSGFDLLVPENTYFFNVFESKFLDMKVKAEMVHCDTTNDVLATSAYYIYPRSSISKTPLMLANHTGIIDSGYRGNLITAFRLLPTADNSAHFVVEKYARLTQICHPSLCPIYVVFIDENELGLTLRGSGGFGSTGV